MSATPPPKKGHNGQDNEMKKSSLGILLNDQPTQVHSPRRPMNIPDWEDGSSLLLKSCVLSDGIMPKSFSTGDITAAHLGDQLHRVVSEVALSSLVHRCGFTTRLEQASRSCSTWVAVGELATTSQLPSPQFTGSHSINSLQFSTSAINASSSSAGGCSSGGTTGAHQNSTSFTSADFIRSVNKKVRHQYIQRRLLTYRILERLSHSEINLDGSDVCREHPKSSRAGPTEIIVPTITLCPTSTAEEETAADAMRSALKKPTSTGIKTVHYNSIVERERGRALTKYERNMMIFNWLHTLDVSCPVEDDVPASSSLIVE